MVLLVRVCVSVVPTTAPVGAVTVVNEDEPLPTTKPVRAEEPVPPLETDNGVLRFEIVPPEIAAPLIVLLVRVWVSVVPTTKPVGAATVEKELEPLAVTIPAVKVLRPVPPFATVTGSEKFVLDPNVLLVKVCVSVVPTIAPEGAATVEKEPVPLPIRTPVRDVAPVPPLLTPSTPPPERDTAFQLGAAWPFDVRTYPAGP
jgi:hypothetical protein